MTRSTLLVALLALLPLSPALAQGKKDKRRGRHPLGAEIQAKAEGRFQGKVSVGKEGRLTVDYDFKRTSQEQLNDFDSQGWDEGARLRRRANKGRWLLSVGSQSQAIFRHRHGFVDDFRVELSLNFNRLADRAQVGLILSDKLAFAWGEKSCKPSALARMGRQDKATLEQWKNGKVVIERSASTVKVFLNGKQIGEHELKSSKELDELQLGIYGKDLSVTITRLTISGYLPEFDQAAVEAAAEPEEAKEEEEDEKKEGEEGQ